MRPIAPLVAAAVAACGLREVTLPPGEEQIVVQGVLNAQATTQVLWIERSTPAGAPIAFGVRPLESPPSRVEVRENGGATFSFAVDTNPARFVAAFTPRPDHRYDLLVEVDGRVLRGTTVVPPPITIVDPATDTVSVTEDSLHVSWASGTARSVAVYVSPDAKGVNPYLAFPQWVQGDTVIAIPIFLAPESKAFIWVVAVDSVTARVFRSSSLFDGDRAFEGNVTGGAGLFGAVTSDRLVVRNP